MPAPTPMPAPRFPCVAPQHSGVGGQGIPATRTTQQVRRAPPPPNLPPHTPMAYDTLSFLDAQTKAYNTNPNNSTVHHATWLTCPLPGGDIPSLRGCSSGSGTKDTDPLRPVRTYRGTVGGYHVFTNRCWDRDGMSRMSGSDIRLPCRLEPGQVQGTYKKLTGQHCVWHSATLWDLHQRCRSLQSANMMYLGTYQGGPRCRSHPDCTHAI
jgi:hypothetical protein